MKIETLVVGPLQENCYLLVDEEAGEAVLVDPGDEGARIVRAVRASRARLAAIWLTHAHFDHVGGIAEVHREWPVPVYLHQLSGRVPTAGQRASACGIPRAYAPSLRST